MTAKEYPENVAGQVSVYRFDTYELTVEFSYSRQFKAECLTHLEIGQGVRVPLYTIPPSVDALIAEIMDCEINGHYGDTGYDVGQVNAVIDKYRSAK